jgi:hypothetical protein
MFTRTAARTLLSILAVFVTLCVLWAQAASAAEPASGRPELGEGWTCAAPRALEQGSGTVQACEYHAPSTLRAARVAQGRARTTAAKQARTGTTTVMHYGHRAPVYTITVLASR